MKKTLLPLTIAAFTLIAACKPSETHYRAAYESAVAKRDSGSGMESTIYNRYRDLAKHDIVASDGDTVSVITEYVGITSDTGNSTDSVRAMLRPYNVVVGSFKQIFNAKEMIKRLSAAGYDFPFVLHTREPLYYVVALTCATPAEAAHGLRRVEADTCMRLRQPLPFVLMPAHLKHKAGR